MVRLLIDTNVLVSDALWCGLLAMRELAENRGRSAVGLFTTTEVLNELNYVVKRVFGRRPPRVLAGVVRHRRSTASVLDTSELPPELHAEHRAFIRDPDDAFLDIACRGFRIDMLVTNDIQAFRQVSDDERGYRICGAEACLLELWSELTADSDDTKVAHFTAAWERICRDCCEEIGLEPEHRSLFDQLRRARAGRFASALKAQRQDVSTRRR